MFKWYKNWKKKRRDEEAARLRLRWNDDVGEYIIDKPSDDDDVRKNWPIREVVSAPVSPVPVHVPVDDTPRYDSYKVQDTLHGGSHGTPHNHHAHDYGSSSYDSGSSYSSGGSDSSSSSGSDSSSSSGSND